MPSIAAVAKIDFPYKVEQKEIKSRIGQIFPAAFPHLERLIGAFDNTGIIHRNFCKPLDYYFNPNTFEQNNNEYIRLSLEYSIKAIEDCLAGAHIFAAEVTDVIFVSSSGLATPSVDALIINAMRLNPHVNRTPVWGLGCGGGVSGVAKANTAATANPDAVVLLVAVELCTLTYMRSDYSKSNFIAASLFSDGVAACIITGDNYEKNRRQRGAGGISIAATSSMLYYDSLNVMGWEFLNTGFKVLFSKDIPTIINDNIKGVIGEFLTAQGLALSDVKNFIFHPGGTKVLDAYEQSLSAPGDFLKNTREVMHAYGNMSSVTVLYVLEKFLREGYEPGYGLMLAMGPGFSSEMALLDMKK